MNYVSYIACTLAGLILCAISFVGLYNIPAQPIETLTILLEPMGYGANLDNGYLWVLMLLGVWLLLFFWVRVASGIALGLVLLKIIVLNGWVPIAITIGICILLTLVVTTAHFGPSAPDQ